MKRISRWRWRLAWWWHGVRGRLGKKSPLIELIKELEKKEKEAK